jgi:murein L,D-transpeptidase YcbB/YkuD
MTAVAAVIAVAAAFPAAADPANEVLRQRIEAIRANGGLDIGSSRIAAIRLVPLLYEGRGFELAWTRPAMIEALLSAVAAAPSHGLDPEDYHFAALTSMLEATDDAIDTLTDRVDLDLLLTDALARYAFTLHYGKLDPTHLDPVWNLSRVIVDDEAVRLFQETLDTGDIAALLDEVAPTNPYYRRLRLALAEYRTVAASGGWPVIPDGPTLAPGARGPRVAALRGRLEASGDLAGFSSADPDLFDESMVEAVVRFQRRHGLDEDGKAGPKTLAALNVPVEARIDQIRANLERDRWVFRDLPDDFIIVNIAGFELTLVRGGTAVWTTRVQVGKTIHKTPIFASQMTYLVFNPTWTVPPGILRNETLPAIRKDPEYLAENDMVIIDSDGSVVDPATVDFNGGFPYMIRQEPGPKNALGRVKFMFPNPYFIYLHDTPSKRLFARSERAFSHGCIRTENPLDLAELVLAGTEGWDRTRIDRVVDSGVTTTVMLDNPLAVLLLYWTADVQPDGSVEFREDIYGRDARIIEGLDDAFEFPAPRGVPAASP